MADPKKGGQGQKPSQTNLVKPSQSNPSKLGQGDPIGKGRWLLLTFDDGPEPGKALELILDTLRSNNILSEFYVIGEEVKGSPARAKLIVERGHKIQNHSWSHPKKPKNLAEMSEAEVRSQLEKTQDAIYEATRVTPTKFRPPYGIGARDPEVVKTAQALHLAIALWDIDTRDWADPRGLGESKMQDIYQQCKSVAKSHLNVLLHVQQETARDLPMFILRVKSWGFGFAQP